MLPPNTGRSHAGVTQEDDAPFKTFSPFNLDLRHAILQNGDVSFVGKPFVLPFSYLRSHLFLPVSQSKKKNEVPGLILVIRTDALEIVFPISFSSFFLSSFFFFFHSKGLFRTGTFSDYLMEVEQHAGMSGIGESHGG